MLIEKSKFLCFGIFILCVSQITFAQSGGTFTITESVVAPGGGQNSVGGTFSVDGTAGQAIAGNAMNGPPFGITSGFWNFTPLVPSAALVGVSGRVRTANGAGILNALITLTAADGSTQINRSSTFGYFRFNDVAAGDTYIVSVTTKRYCFGQSSVVVGVFEEVTGLDFVANPLP